MIANLTNNVNYIIRHLKKAGRLLIADTVIRGLFKIASLMVFYLIAVLVLDFFFLLFDVIIFLMHSVFLLLCVFMVSKIVLAVLRFSNLKFTANYIEKRAELNQNLMIITDYFTGKKEYNYSPDILAHIAGQLKQKCEKISLIQQAGLSKVYFRLLFIICSTLTVFLLYSYSNMDIDKYIQRAMLKSKSFSPKTDFHWYLPQKIITAEPDMPVEITAYARGKTPKEVILVLMQVADEKNSDNTFFKKTIQREEIESDLSSYNLVKSFIDNENYKYYFKYAGMVSPTGQIYTGFAPEVENIRVSLTDPNGTVSDFSFETANPLIKAKKGSSAEVVIQIQGPGVNAHISEDGKHLNTKQLSNVKRIYFLSNLNMPKSYTVMLENIDNPGIKKACRINFILEMKLNEKIFMTQDAGLYDKTLSKERKKYLQELYKIRDLNRQLYVERTASKGRAEKVFSEIARLKKSLKEIQDNLKTASFEPTKEIFENIKVKRNMSLLEIDSLISLNEKNVSFDSQKANGSDVDEVMTEILKKASDNIERIDLEQKSSQSQELIEHNTKFIANAISDLEKAQQCLSCRRFDNSKLIRKALKLSEDLKRTAKNDTPEQQLYSMLREYKSLLEEMKQRGILHKDKASPLDTGMFESDFLPAMDNERTNPIFRRFWRNLSKETIDKAANFLAETVNRNADNINFNKYNNLSDVRYHLVEKMFYEKAAQMSMERPEQ